MSMSTAPGVWRQSLPIRECAFSELRHDVMGGMLSLHEEFGPVCAIQDGVSRVLFVFDPVYNRQVLSDVRQFETRFFSIRGPKRSSQRRLTCGLVGMNGDQWKRNRRLVQGSFGLKQIATYRPAIERLATQAAARWPDKGRVDMSREMTRFMLEVTSSILFGLDETDLAYDIGEQIAKWVKLNHELGVGALIPDETFSERYEELLEFSKGLEQRVMEMITLRRQGPQDGDDVLSILLRTHDEEGGLSDEELVGQSCVLFGAAHLTTANSLTWTLLLQAQHPSVMRELMQELGTGGVEEKPEGASLLERVIRESMRVLPASAYSLRVPTSPVTIGPFEALPRGTPIVFSPLITHRLESLYEEPRLFRPDRWLTLKPVPYGYLPFGAGPRMCLGGPLALEVMRLSLPKFLQRRMTVAPGSAINAAVESTMLNPVSGVPMDLAPHDGTFAATPIEGNVLDLVDFVEADDPSHRARSR